MLRFFGRRNSIFRLDDHGILHTVVEEIFELESLAGIPVDFGQDVLVVGFCV